MTEKYIACGLDVGPGMACPRVQNHKGPHARPDDESRWWIPMDRFPDQDLQIEPRFELIRYRSESQPTTYLLARLDNGMVVGGCTGTDGGTWQAQFGVDAAGAQSRSFTSDDWAKAWLKDRAREYCGREDVTFESRDG